MEAPMRHRAMSLAMTLSLVLPAVLLAHGTGNKVVGTITAVHASMNHFEVKTADGHVVGVKVSDATKFSRTGGAAAAFTDLKEGSRVVVTTTGEGDARTATLVKLGSAAAASAKSAPPSHKH